MSVAACPKPETLAAFARGDLADDDLAEVAGHVGGCEACCRALQQVSDDSLAGLARAAAVAPVTVHSAGPPAALAPVPVLHPDDAPAGFTDHPRYRIVSKLGAGGMGTVYKAEDQLMGRVIALKVVSPHLTAKASAVERFRKEIRAAAQLNHPSVILAHDTGEAGGAHFLVMEFVDGISLDRLVAKKGPLPVPMACTFARQAALGLQHAADKGMVHRDIKPQNLMVTRKGQVKILDFGLARFARADDADDGAHHGKPPFGAGNEAGGAPRQPKQQPQVRPGADQGGVTNPHLLMGTPDYLSPEQAKNSHDVDPRSDVYSLGCTLYFMLTGAPPFGAAVSLIDKLLAHTKDAPPAIRLERLDVTEGLADVLAKMMAKKPGDRYQTAAEAAAALLPHTRSDAGGKEPVFEIVDVTITPAPLVSAPEPQRTFDTDPVAGATLTEAPRPKRHKRHKKRTTWWQRQKWPVLGGAAAAIVFVAAVVALSGKRPAAGPKDAPADPPASAKAAPTPPKAKDDKGGKDEKGKDDKANPWVAPTVVAPPKPGPKVLYVLPNDGVFLPEFAPVRERLERAGATVKTCAGEARPARVSAPPAGEPVPIDIWLRDLDDKRAREFAAVVFCGHNWDEYTAVGPKAVHIGYTARQALADGRVVGAIGTGQGVLVEHGLLRDRAAAYSPALDKERPDFFRLVRRIQWKKEGVVTDGKIVTAARPEDADAFADALLKAIDAK